MFITGGKNLLGWQQDRKVRIAECQEFITINKQKSKEIHQIAHGRTAQLLYEISKCSLNPNKNLNNKRQIGTAQNSPSHENADKWG